MIHRYMRAMFTALVVVALGMAIMQTPSFASDVNKSPPIVATLQERVVLEEVREARMYTGTNSSATPTTMLGDIITESTMASCTSLDNKPPDRPLRR